MVWFVRRPAPRIETVTEATFALQLTRHDSFGAPSKPVPIRDRARVQRILTGLGVDALSSSPCPPDYATADLGLLLTGRDVYARRNAYVWDLNTTPRVVLVDETGCKAGTVADPNALRSEL